MNDEFFDRLRASDPASDNSTPDLASIKARVMHHIDTVDSNVIAFDAKRSWNRGLRFAAAAAVLVVAAGGGFVGGRMQPTNELGNAAVGTAVDGGLAQAAPKVAADRMASVAGSYVAGWGGATLVPAVALNNSSGTANAYMFDASGVSADAVGQRLADALGIQMGKATVGGDGAFSWSDNSGNIWVGADAMVTFNASNNERSPWMCGSDLGVNSKEPAAAGAGASSTSNADAVQAECDKQWPAPSDADALAAAKAVVAKLDVPAGALLRLQTQSAWTRSMYNNPRSNTVTATLVIDGEPTALTWNIEVSKQGVFSAYGFAAGVSKGVEYPTVSATEAAARTALRKWQSFGPNQIASAQPTVLSVHASAATATSAPTPRTRDGKPMITAYRNEVSVLAAVPGLMQVWQVDGGVMLVPAWNFTDSNGAVWQMLAVADAFIDWQDQGDTGMVAYDAMAR